MKQEAPNGILIEMGVLPKKFHKVSSFKYDFPYNSTPGGSEIIKTCFVSSFFKDLRIESSGMTFSASRSILKAFQSI